MDISFLDADEWLVVNAILLFILYKSTATTMKMNSIFYLLWNKDCKMNKNFVYIRVYISTTEFTSHIFEIFIFVITNNF